MAATPKLEMKFLCSCVCVCVSEEGGGEISFAIIERPIYASHNEFKWKLDDELTIRILTKSF